jgi:hypothetical protein
MRVVYVKPEVIAAVHERARPRPVATLAARRRRRRIGELDRASVHHAQAHNSRHSSSLQLIGLP